MQIETVAAALAKFTDWLQSYGEESYDHQTYYAAKVGKIAKRCYYRAPCLGTLAVAPMVFSEALAPWARPLFGPKLRFPIADAHYAMGFAFLYDCHKERKYFDAAVHFLNVLKKTRSAGYRNYCWGYPFDWVTRNGMIARGTPLITTTPYAFEAFDQIVAIERKEAWLEIMRSIAEHALNDIQDFDYSPTAKTCGYSPRDRSGGVINASAYRAFLLARAARCLKDEKYMPAAERNLNFVLENQQLDGCWYYAVDNIRDFVDHFHTCFVLKALVKIERLTGHPGCRRAIEKGVAYYVRALFDADRLPKPFAKAPRATVYRKELYDYAECINLGVLLQGRFAALDERVAATVADLLERWQKTDGSFRTRKLIMGWDNVPMHRWAQAQVFRSLSFLLKSVGAQESTGSSVAEAACASGPSLAEAIAARAPKRLAARTDAIVGKDCTALKRP